MNWSGKRVVITGASSGIGRATAIEFAGQGANLVLAARRSDRLEAVAEECRRDGVRVITRPTDVTNRDACFALIAAAEDELGGVDVLVNNAGFAIFDQIADASIDDVESMMRTNFFGMLHCTQAALPAMLARRSGSIVNVASIMGIMGVAGMGGYSASKFAIVGLTESLRDEVIDRGVNVSVVCPGTTESEFFVTAERKKMPGASRLILAIKPEAVARAIVRAAATGRARTILPFTASTYMRMKELLPRTAHFLMRRVSSLLEDRRL